MANEKKDHSVDLDLDSILSEINSNIQKEVSKKIPEETKPKAKPVAEAKPKPPISVENKSKAVAASETKSKAVISENMTPKASSEKEMSVEKQSPQEKTQKMVEAKQPLKQGEVSASKVEEAQEQQPKETREENAQAKEKNSIEQRKKDKKKQRKASKDTLKETAKVLKTGSLEDEKATSFVHKAKIIEKEPSEDDMQHPVRFIAVTASEVVEEPKKLVRDTFDEEAVEITKSKETVKDDISRENNRHIKRLRKKQQKPKKTRRQKMTALLGVIMTLFIIIGVISTVWVSVGFAGELINNTSQKKELAQEIFPFVIVDIPEFTDPAMLENSAVVASAIWDFIISEPDKSKYTVDELGSMDVPAVDIEHYIRKLYGNDIEIVHQSVDDSNIMMTYNPERQMYNIESTPKFLPYTPRVDKITRTGDIYTLNVSYILPDVMWNLDVDDKTQQVDKKMEYVLKKNRNGYQVLAVKLLEVTGLTSSMQQVPAVDGGFLEDDPEDDIVVSENQDGETVSGEDASDTTGEGSDDTQETSSASGVSEE